MGSLGEGVYRDRHGIGPARSLLCSGRRSKTRKSGDFCALSAHRELRNHRQHADGGARGQARVDRLVLRPPLRFAQRVRGDPRRRDGGTVRDRPDRRRVGHQAALLAGDQRPGHPLPVGRRGGGDRGLHAGRRAGDERVARSPDPPGAGGARPRQLRPALPSGVRLRPRRPRDGDHRRQGGGLPLPGAQPAARHRDPPAHRRPRGHRRVHLARGGERDLRDPPDRQGERDVSASLGGADGGAVPGDRRLLALLDRQVDLPWPLARDGPPLGAGAQAADLRAHRRDRGGPHLQPPRAHRRGAQLGLPLHLDPRRRLHHLLAAAHRPHRGGLAVHGLARRPLRGSRPRPGAADRLRHRRPPRPHRDHPRPPRGVPRLAAGARRQRRRPPAPARHLRRADGLGLPVQQARGADRLRLVAPSARAAPLRGRQLAAGGRGDLGGARRPAAVRLLEADVLGSDGPRPAPRLAALLPGRPPALARHPRRDLRDDHEARLEREAAELRRDARRRVARRLEPADAARLLHRAERSADAEDDRGDPQAAGRREGCSRTGWSTATTPRTASTASPATRGRSTCAPSGWSRR